MISGGAALDRETEEFWHRLGYAVDSGLWIDRDDFARQLEPSFPHQPRLHRQSSARREIKLAEGGEILVRGSGVASGYWNGRELQPVARTEDEGCIARATWARSTSKQSFFQGARRK